MTPGYYWLHDSYVNRATGETVAMEPQIVRVATTTIRRKEVEVVLYVGGGKTPLENFSKLARFEGPLVPNLPTTG